MPAYPVMVADLGGTSLRVAIDTGGALTHQQVVATADLGGDATAWLRRWVDDRPVRPLAACVAVAAPVRCGRVRLTNADVWIDAGGLDLPAVLVNDLQAAAMGVDLVGPQGRVHLAGPAPVAGGPIGVLGVGTGLGQAVRDDGVVLPGEGGHAAFSPVDEDQRRLHGYLLQRHDYVDWEHVASGSALPALLDHAEELHGRSPRLGEARAQAAAAGRSVGSVVLALADQDPACSLALRLLLGALGVEAGNMALRHLTTGGIWLVGGVAARLQPWLEAGPFHQAFERRGRFSELAAATPRVLVLDELVGLRGAGQLGRELLA